MTRINPGILIKIFYLIIIGFVICSCVENTNTQSGSLKSYDSSHNASNLPLEDLDSPHANNNPNSNLEVRKNKHALPYISSVNYVNVNSLFDQWFADDKFKDSLIQVLEFYHKRFPDKDKYQYYFTVHCYTDSVYKSICSNNDMTFGLLTLYEPASQKANLFCVEYNFLSNSETYQMYFSMDSNNTVHLVETMMIGGEEDEEGNLTVEDLSRAEHFISIKKTGEIQIESNDYWNHD